MPRDDFRPFTRVKTFSATSFRDRDLLGERVTAWIRENDVEIVDTVVQQSSDHAYHCISIILFLF
jgi:hypothetical protein